MAALASGFQMHVAKPVNPGELVSVIASLVGRQRWIRALLIGAAPSLAQTPVATLEVVRTEVSPAT